MILVLRREVLWDVLLFVIEVVVIRGIDGVEMVDVELFLDR